MRAAIAALLLAVPLAGAAPTIKAVQPTDVQPGGFAALGVDGGTAVWSISPDAVQDGEFGGVLIFTGKAGTTYTVTALIVDFDNKKVIKLKQAVRFLDTPGPTPPPPGPGPSPTPDPPAPTPPTPPTPPPAPVAGPAKFVVVIEESATAAATRGELYSDKALIDYYAAQGIKARRVDKDVVDAAGKPPADVARFLDDAKGKPLPRVYLVGGDGKQLYAGNLHDDPADLLKLLQQHAGK